MPDYALLQRNRGLAVSYAQKFTSHAQEHDAEDIQAAALMGLAEAVAEFNPAHPNASFTSLAYLKIREAVLKQVHQIYYPHLSFREFLSRPGILKDTTPAAESSPSLLHKFNLSQFVPDQLSENSAVAADLFSQVDSEMVLQKLRQALPTILSENEQFILVRRFGLDFAPPATFQQLAAIKGLPRQTVSRIHSNAVQKLHNWLTKTDHEETTH